MNIQNKYIIDECGNVFIKTPHGYIWTGRSLAKQLKKE